MWLWFFTSFHSQLSDRFLFRWHLLHDDTQKCGTAQEWGSCCPTCQALLVTSSPLPLPCGSKTTKQQQNLRHSYALPLPDDPTHTHTHTPFVSLSIGIAPWAAVIYLPGMSWHRGFTCAGSKAQLSAHQSLTEVSYKLCCGSTNNNKNIYNLIKTLNITAKITFWYTFD